jgi:hypothetical protein
LVLLRLSTKLRQGTCKYTHTRKKKKPITTKMVNLAKQFACNIIVAAAAMSTALADFTLTAGGLVKFAATEVSFSHPITGLAVTCNTFNLVGDVVGPGISRQFGSIGMSLTASVSDCQSTLGLTTIKPTGTWVATVINSEISPDIWPVVLSAVTVSVEAPLCSIGVAGELEGTIDMKNGKFTPKKSSLKIMEDAPGLVCSVLKIVQGVSINVNGVWDSVGASFSIEKR